MLGKVPCYEDALNMILDFDDQDVRGFVRVSELRIPFRVPFCYDGGYGNPRC